MKREKKKKSNNLKPIDMYQTITEENSNIVFAVIKSKMMTFQFKDRKEDKNIVVKRVLAVKKAVKEEWSYSEVNLTSYKHDEINNQMTFDCATEDGDKEIRVIDLEITTLYK